MTENRELPILFNTEMVQAILRGDKTVTRRLIKRKKIEEVLSSPARKQNPNIEDAKFINCLVDTPYNTDDILYVRETWYYEEHMHDLTVGEPDLSSGRYLHRYVYKASSPDYPVNTGVGRQGWKPSIHMPKEAARIFLKVTDVRVERLQEITEDSVYQEGYDYVCPYEHRVRMQDHDSMCWCEADCHNPIKACDSSISELFGTQLWNSTIKKSDIDLYGWNANPWVWVIEFERCEKPE